MTEPDIVVLDRGCVRDCLAQLDPLDVVESILRQHAAGETLLPPESYLAWTNGAGAYSRSLSMPGALLGGPEPHYGLKVINAAVSNPASGLERAGGITMLFDPDTARPRVLAEAGLLSALRTAAYTMVSLRHLGPERFGSVSLIGCGAIARAHLDLLRRYFPEVGTVYVHDLDGERAETFAGWARRRTGIDIVVERSPRQAVRASGVVVTLTTAEQSYIDADWFCPGSFVAHVSLDDLSEGVFRSAQAVFVDDVDLVRDNPRRILGRLMAAGTIAAPDDPAPRRAGSVRVLDGTLSDVLVGRRPAIRPSSGTVVSNPFGMSILDIGLVAAVARVAEQSAVGQHIRLV